MMDAAYPQLVTEVIPAPLMGFSQLLCSAQFSLPLILY